MFGNTDTFEGQDVIYSISMDIAEKTGLDVCELPPLNETIDAEALDAFLRNSNSPDTHPERSVEFPYCGYRVTVDSTGQVQLHPKPESTSSIESA